MCFRCENHKIPNSFASVITKFRNIGQKKATAFTGDRFKSSIGISLSLR